MQRRIFYSSVFLLLFFAATPTRAFAALQITEVMYDPPGSSAQWVELYNSGSTPVTMTAGTKGWRVDDGGSSKHVLVDPAATSNGGGRGSLTIAPQTFAIITNDPAGFITQYGGSYSVIKSAISPNQTTGATIALLDDLGATVDSITYTTAMGGKNDGNSLHRLSSGTLVAAAPDPGVNTGSYTASPVQNTNSTDTTQSAGGTTDTSSSNGVLSDTAAQSSSASGGSAPVPLAPRIAAPSIVTVGAGSFFTGTALTAKGALVPNARYIWNFGDGATAEGQNVFHTYPYPGTYAVVLTVAADTASGIAQQRVQAVPAQVGMLVEPDGSLVLSNQSSQDLNVGLWSVSSASSTFVIPKDTILLGTQSVHFSVVVLGMRVGADALLRYPNNMLAASAASDVSPAVARAAAGAGVVSSNAAGTLVSSNPLASRAPVRVVSASTPVASPAVAASQPVAAVATNPAHPSAHEQLASVAASGFSLPLWESLAGLLVLVAGGVAASFFLRAGHTTSAVVNQYETYSAASEFEIE